MKTLLQPSRTSTSLLATTAPLPTPTHPDDVLVRVHATSPCAGELRWAIDYPAAIPADKLLVPCQDLAGTVVTASGKFHPGDRVYCRVSAARAGAARDYALPRASELARIPPSLGWVEAAATPLSALTAWQALFVQGTLDAAGIEDGGSDDARARNGQVRVLVAGAGGGVGSWLVQLAALAGAGAVVAVCGPDKADAVRALGATEVVDYRKTTIKDWVAGDGDARECGLVVDVIGGETLAGCWAAVRDGGALVSITAAPDALRPEGVVKTLERSLFFIVEPLGSNLEEIGELVEAGRVRPTVDSVWEFDEYEKAFERLDSGHAKGKVVIKVSGEA
ncbi:hypothetical protein B0T17DRAFT_588296 [Bombardia bombarda]|uniref:Enoyl reductase (ER) domain-containing protein n=1 Tax=Bombardia bombarda TaxID=252184 RepID=A0AA39XNS9_9PEZI|nr:hypothetical protein B0T17DRAFT_588296 [Bombardia bombarda]